MKKVLIITLKLGTNYGGILQAYALQSTVKKLGFKAETGSSPGDLRQRAANTMPFLSVVAAKLKGRQYNDSGVTTRNTKQFIKKYIQQVDFRAAKRDEYSAYIVGSDQVWRRPYTYVPHNLFSFARGSAPRISYAASFGKDNLEEYGDELIAETKYLAQKLAAISVREDTGVEVARKYWGVMAEHHVDPTLLVGAAEYKNLVKTDDLPTKKADGELFAYVLDTASNKRGVVDVVARNMKLKPFTVIDGDENDGKPMPPVTQWLKSFIDAKYVVTDSFHGVVFSIIFNRPFIAIGNKDRGLARFQSLLRLFELEDRLVESVDDVSDELIKKPIDWTTVNKKVKAEQKRSMDYLRKYLK